MSKDYQVVKFNVSRYAIADKNGKIIDDAGGHGFKTKPNAYKALAFKYKPNNEKFQNDLKESEEFLKTFQETHSLNFIEILDKALKNAELNSSKDSKPYTISELYIELEKTYTISIPKNIRKHLIRKVENN